MAGHVVLLDLAAVSVDIGAPLLGTELLGGTEFLGGTAAASATSRRTSGEHVEAGPEQCIQAVRDREPTDLPDKLVKPVAGGDHVTIDERPDVLDREQEIPWARW